MSCEGRRSSPAASVPRGTAEGSDGTVMLVAVLLVLVAAPPRGAGAPSQRPRSGSPRASRCRDRRGRQRWDRRHGRCLRAHGPPAARLHANRTQYEGCYVPTWHGIGRANTLGLLEEQARVRRQRGRLIVVPRGRGYGVAEDARLSGVAALRPSSRFGRCSDSSKSATSRVGSERKMSTSCVENEQRGGPAGRLSSMRGGWSEALTIRAQRPGRVLMSRRGRCHAAHP